MLGCKCTAVSERICRNDRLRVSDAAEAGQFGEVVRCGKAQHPGSSLPHSIENRDSEIKSTSTYPKHETGGGWADAGTIGWSSYPYPSLTRYWEGIIFRGLVPLNYQPRGKMRACVGSWNEREGGRVVLRYSSHPGVHLENCHAMPRLAPLMQ
jgi:hypothetical protein